MDVTVGVIPRERFRPLAASLKSLFSHIPKTVPVIVVEGGAPNEIHNQMTKLQKQRDFHLIATDHFVLPNAARNMALKDVTTKYVVFCDNDLEYTPNWLETMVAKAEEHDAAAVAPTILIGPTKEPMIHHAGGTFHRLRDNEGRITLSSKHNYTNVLLSEAIDQKFAASPELTENFEFHCVLLNAHVLREIGGMDERLTTSEHLDISLRLKAGGHKIIFASGAVVLYRAFDRFNGQDWPYFHFRWSLKRAVASRKIFAENWGLRTDNISEKTVFAAGHIKRAIGNSGIKYPKFLPQNSILARRVRWLNDKMAMRHDSNIPDAPAPFFPPKPAPGGLDLAGIAWKEKD